MSSPDEFEPSSQLVLQRVRNRMIEYFELTADEGAQAEYQARAPISVANELINQWDDWFHEPLSAFAEPVFSSAERNALVEFNRTRNEVAGATRAQLPALETFQASAAWMQLQRAASNALGIFSVRGRLPEHESVHLKYVLDRNIVGVALVKNFWNLSTLFVAPAHQR
jgi:hypothetical protein